jgi:hypothetical protein
VIRFAYNIPTSPSGNAQVFPRWLLRMLDDCDVVHMYNCQVEATSAIAEYFHAAIGTLQSESRFLCLRYFATAVERLSHCEMLERPLEDR